MIWLFIILVFLKFVSTRHATYKFLTKILNEQELNDREGLDDSITKTHSNFEERCTCIL